MDLEILEHSGEGYLPLVRYQGWRVAVINYDIRFDEQCFTRMERHHLTDEVFILINGNAVLVVGKEQKRYEMEVGKIYNVKKNVWHHVFVSKDARVIVVENDDTSKENSEYLEV